MCGIAGFLPLGGAAPDEACLQAMEQALAHRGPDGKGRYVSGGAVLLHTRLSIIDLETGDQPFTETTDKGPVTLVGNGEIYNYIEQRAELSNVDFKTSSDCEVPLHLYLKYGLDFTSHLRGMYAIAILDERDGKLVLSRDPFGIKPLYYVETDKGFAFASEPQVLIKGGFVDAAGHDKAIDELLQLQFTCGVDTALAGVRRVLPGETLVVKDGRIQERQYRKPLPETGPQAISEAEALRQLDDLLNDAIGIHQRSDVPYGMFLSGGIDSSVVLAMMDRLNAEPVRAFAAGFSGSNVHDERDHAELLARKVGADFEAVEFSEEDFWALLPRIAKAMDDPAADYAVLPTYKLAGLARKRGIKVVLSGEGGDELFGGYGRYRRAMRSCILGGRPMRSLGILNNFDLLRDPLPKTRWRAGIKAAECDAKKKREWTGLQQAQAVDIADWLPHDLLTKLDRCLMAHGVEGRVPFLDSKLAAFAFSLPDNLKTKRKKGKWLLRKWLDTALPEAKPFSPKRGFTVPVGDWIASKGAKLGSLVARQPGIHERFKPDAVEALFKTIGKKEAQAQWSLLFYALWHQEHIVGSSAEGSTEDALG